MARPLHAIEKKLLKTLSGTRVLDIADLSEKAGVMLDQARRAVEWLEGKGFVRVKRRTIQQIGLGKEGLRALGEGLPERRFIELLARSGGRSNLARLVDDYKGSREEFSTALGRARSKEWISLSRERSQTYVNLEKKPDSIPEEELLQYLSRGWLSMEELSSSQRALLEELCKRPNFISIRRARIASVGLTLRGRKRTEAIVERPGVVSLRPEHIVSGTWRRLKLTPIDVEAASPTIMLGKKHPLQRFIDEVREIFVALGFEEIDGPIVQPSFWNFDALYIPQDHSAREMQDTFYLAGMEGHRLGPRTLVDRVALVHKMGWKTGSSGWGYIWSEEKARHLVLRTHTTAVTVKYLQDHQPKEARVFSVGRVFRNEKSSFKSLPEFYQIEGITVGGGLSIRDMMGLLSKFYLKLGVKQVKFWPTFFPYTEPSLQAVIFHPQLKKWVELCGMGVFRPEVTLPLGVVEPVLAWGGGLERLAMLRYGLNDIRTLYANDLGWLRLVPVCL